MLRGIGQGIYDMLVTREFNGTKPAVNIFNNRNRCVKREVELCRNLLCSVSEKLSEKDADGSAVASDKNGLALVPFR